MAEPENKDKIKEILEGHSKKFTTTELIVGIVVILIIGVGIGYAVFKILTPPSQPQMQELVTQVEQPANPSTPPEVTQPTVNQPSSYTENNTETSNNTIMPEQNSQTEASNNTEQQLPGPEIIPPAQQTNIQTKPEEQAKPETAEIKTNVEKTKVTKRTVSKARPKPKHTKHHLVTKHKYTPIKHKYVLQVSSNKNRKLALLAVIKLRKCGHKAYTKEVEVNGVKYTRVYVGPIVGYLAAKEEAKNIKRQLHLKYLPLIKKDD